MKVLTIKKPAFLLRTNSKHQTVVPHIDEVDRLQRTVLNSFARQDPFVDQLLTAKIEIYTKRSKKSSTCKQCLLHNEGQGLEMVLYQPEILLCKNI